PPEEGPRPARVEPGVVIVRAFREPGKFAGPEGGPAGGAGEPPEPPVARTAPKPGRKEPPVRALGQGHVRGPLPPRVSEAHAGRPGRPGPGVEDPALDRGDHGSAVRARAIVHRAEGGGDAGTEDARIADGPAVDQAVLDRQGGPQVVLEVERREVV